VFGIAIGALLSFVVMQLWNHLLPGLIAGFHTITFWQAVGLLILSKILFGGFRRPGPPSWVWKRRMAERWAKMTPEERERFRAGWGRCGHWQQYHETEQPKA
jgi:hypothetical protein